jgi:hypothetical protein
MDNYVLEQYVKFLIIICLLILNENKLSIFISFLSFIKLRTHDKKKKDSCWENILIRKEVILDLFLNWA